MMKNYQYKNKYSISYGDYGEEYEKSIVLFHGLLGSAKQKKLGEYFNSEKIRLISIARLGYGESDFVEIKSYFEFANIVKELLESLKLEKYDIFGISAGAPHAYALASLNPNKTSNIFIYSGLSILYKKEVLATYPKSTQDFYEMIKQSDIKSIGQNIVAMYEPYFTDKMKEMDEYKDSIQNEFQGIGQEAMLQILPWDFEIEDVKQKVYLQHSIKDEIVPFESVEKSMQFIKNPTLIKLEKEAHYDENSFKNFMKFICEKSK